MSQEAFTSHQDFADWFSNPMERAIETGESIDEETRTRVTQLHTILRPYLLRRLKADVEKQMPSKFEHIVYCRLSKRQRYLYDEFMSRAQTRETLSSGNFMNIISCLMQLRKVCNHPDLFEVRPIVTSFAMKRSAIADYEIQDLLVRRRLLSTLQDPNPEIAFLGLDIAHREDEDLLAATERQRLDASSRLKPGQISPSKPNFDAAENVEENEEEESLTIAAWEKKLKSVDDAALRHRFELMRNINQRKCSRLPLLGISSLTKLRSVARDSVFSPPLPLPKRQLPLQDQRLLVAPLLSSYCDRSEQIRNVMHQFAFVTPKVVARDMPSQVFNTLSSSDLTDFFPLDTPDPLAQSTVKLSIAFPDRWLLQYDCGKLQKMAELLKVLNEGGHRALIFTQMTKVLDILEIFLSFHGYLYLRLDGSTKVEDRQILTERFNTDTRIMAFISSTRAGGLGINLTGADTVIFYDSDW